MDEKTVLRMKQRENCHKDSSSPESKVERDKWNENERNTTKPMCHPETLGQLEEEKRWSAHFNIYIYTEKHRFILFYSRLRARFLSVFFFATILVLLLLELLVPVPIVGKPAPATRLFGSPACFLGWGPSAGS